uniref:SCP domain-containing protein n=1 Tax=Oryza brachyantha TaxID=4533 RepID=J3MIB8_ORYBR
MEKGAAFAAVMMAMAVLATTTTGALQVQFSEAEKAQFVQLHNDARAAVGVRTAVAWNEALAAKALEHARYCRKEHIPGPYGENLWWGWSSAAGWVGTPADAMHIYIYIYIY